jgi:hypothetical protein
MKNWQAIVFALAVAFAVFALVVDAEAQCPNGQCCPGGQCFVRPSYSLGHSYSRPNYHRPSFVPNYRPSYVRLSGGWIIIR